MIYFVRDAISGLVKIGYSENPWLRLCKMQSDSPGALTLVGVLDGDQKTEQALHRECAAQRVRGEWFREGGPVRVAIEGATELLRPSAHRSRDPRLSLIAALSEATGVSANATRFWVVRGKVPDRHMAAVARAGLLTVDQLCDAAMANSKHSPYFGKRARLDLVELANVTAQQAQEAA